MISKCGIVAIVLWAIFDFVQVDLVIAAPNDKSERVILYSKFNQFLGINRNHCCERLSNLLIPLDAKKIRSEYDFIIIGSGPAGSVLANRLSLNSTWNVLLIEAGKEETFNQQIPLFPTMASTSKSTWSYYSQPYPGSCLGMVISDSLWWNQI